MKPEFIEAKGEPLFRQCLESSRQLYPSGLAIVVLVIILVLPSLAGAIEIVGRVVKILDGDTIIVLHRGQAMEVRLKGIDCPEWNQPFGDEAIGYITRQALGKQVVVRIPGRDHWQRFLGEVILPDGRNLNRDMVRVGLAWSYRRYLTDERLIHLEIQARAENRGLWAGKEPVPPWIFRRKQRESGPAHP